MNININLQEYAIIRKGLLKLTGEEMLNLLIRLDNEIKTEYEAEQKEAAEEVENGK